MTRVIVEEPPRMLADAEKERERRTEWERSHAKEREAAGGFELVDEERLRYEERLGEKMALFQAVLPPEVYKELEQGLKSVEYTFDAARLEEKQPEKKRDYKSYVKEKRVEPEEKAGKLANAGDVYSAAAYMLAAYEQKDAPEFDEAKADARAMELSGSRAFKAYMKGHPGNLMAAARGTAVEETHDGIAALDADLSRRDAILVDARDSLKSMATGKTKCFHRMLNALDRFVNTFDLATKLPVVKQADKAGGAALGLIECAMVFWGLAWLDKITGFGWLAQSAKGTVFLRLFV